METSQAKEMSPFDIVKKTVTYLFPFAWKAHKSYFIASSLRVVIGAIQPFIAIMMMPLMVDELMGARQIEILLGYAAVIVLGEAVLTMIHSWLDIQTEKDSEKFDNLIKEKMSRKVMELDYYLTEDKKALDQIELAKNGIEWYSGGVNGIAFPIFEIIRAVITMIGVIVLIAIHAPFLLVLTGALLAINAWIQNKANKVEIESYSRLSKLNRVFSYLGWELTDFRYGKDIRLYDAADMMVEKWDAYNKECLANWKWQADQTMKYRFMSMATNIVKDMGNYLYLGILAILGKISIGICIQMMSAGATFQNAMQTIVFNIQDIIKRANYAYEFIKFLNYPTTEDKAGISVEDKPHVIEFKDVSFTYPNTDVKVLNGVNLTLTQGEHLSVVGLNGAGKTTFVKLLCRLYEPTEGEILLDGVNIKEYDYKEYMKLFAPVFQDFKLFSFSVKENILLNETEQEENLPKLLQKVGLEEKINSWEKGADTILFKAFDEKGIEPSGGEQQKMAIARALQKDAPVVILDEPTAALDPIAEYDIYRQFDTLVGGKTAIYISHRLSSCKFCDRIAVFAEGCIKEYGTHDELVILDGGVYAKMFAAQAQYYQ